MGDDQVVARVSIDGYRVELNGFIHDADEPNLCTCWTQVWPSDPKYIDVEKFPDTPYNRLRAHELGLDAWAALMKASRP